MQFGRDVAGKDYALFLRDGDETFRYCTSQDFAGIFTDLPTKVAAADK